MTAFRKNQWLTGGIVSLTLGAAFAPGCGGSNNAAVPNDAGTPDGPVINPPLDGNPSDSPDAASCTTAEAACQNQSTDGLCASGACGPCTEGTPGTFPSGDDRNCNTAYGNATTMFMCSGGICVPGDCRNDTDCGSNANGPICGIVTPNQCGKCQNDAQCVALGENPVCDTTTGACVAAAGSCTGTNTTCTINTPADTCCGSACTPGNCCDNTACTGSAKCVGHICTTCAAVTGTTYTVDPANGNDSIATGNATGNAACAFKTITRALQAIGATPTAGTEIVIKNTATVSKASSGENFPIAVTKSVTITASGSGVTIQPGASEDAFALDPGSTIDGTLGGGTLTIDGNSNSGRNGVVLVKAGTAATLRNVTVQNFAREGIVVTAGSLEITGALSVSGNGTAAVRFPGLAVAGTGQVTISPPGGATASFNNNTQHGILVVEAGSITVVSQSGGAGTVEANGNYIAGVSIQQSGPTFPLNSINGMIISGTTNGNGLRIDGGSHVKVRNSSIGGSSGSGVIVATSVSGSTRNNDLSNIDLGKTSDPGNNTFQAAGANANQGAGICLQVDPGTGTLSAEKNIFNATNCVSGGSLTFSSTACSGANDLGLAPSSPNTTTTGNGIDVAACTHP